MESHHTHHPEQNEKTQSRNETVPDHDRESSLTYLLEGMMRSFTLDDIDNRKLSYDFTQWSLSHKRWSPLDHVRVNNYTQSFNHSLSYLVMIQDNYTERDIWIWSREILMFPERNHSHSLSHLPLLQNNIMNHPSLKELNTQFFSTITINNSVMKPDTISKRLWNESFPNCTWYQFYLIMINREYTY